VVEEAPPHPSSRSPSGPLPFPHLPSCTVIVSRELFTCLCKGEGGESLTGQLRLNRILNMNW
jgi:hypothetical protein